MSDLKNLKETHEVMACQRFLSIYNETENSYIEIVRVGEPNKKEPDCICSDDLAIELVGIYYNKYQAEKIWSTARNKTVSRQPNLQLLTLENLGNDIGKKLQKLNLGNYNGFSGKIILLFICYVRLLIAEKWSNILTIMFLFVTMDTLIDILMRLGFLGNLTVIQIRNLKSWSK